MKHQCRTHHTTNISPVHDSLTSSSHIIRVCSVLLKLGSKTPLPAPNLHTAPHLTTLFSVSLVSLLKAILLQSLAVVQAFLYVNLLLSFLLPHPSFPHSNSPQSLSSFLSRKSLSSISIVHPHHLPFLELFLSFWMNLTLFFLSRPPHLMNL